jgi:AcrR family transcriptional regulator
VKNDEAPRVASSGAEKRWARRKDARPGEIVAAALDCFAERGFTATRLDDVAARAGVTKGTVYLYFQNKEDLFKAVVRESVLPLLERAMGELAVGPEDPRERIRRVVTFLAGELLGSRLSVIPKLVFAEAGNFPVIARFYLDEVVVPVRAFLAGVLREGVDRGQFRPVDPEHAFYSVVAPLLVAALWQNSFGPYEDRTLDGAAMVRQHLDIILRGLAPDTPALGRKARLPCTETH